MSHHQQKSLQISASSKSIGSLVAVSRHGLVHRECTTGTTDQQRFLGFLRNTIGRVEQHDQLQSEKTIYFMDGARYHTAKSIQNFAKENNVRVLVNAPYCPELNPAERFIFLHKTLIQQKLREEW